MRGAWIAALLLPGCASAPAAPPAAVPTVAVPTVPAAVETEPVASADDAADDPAIWRNRRDPAASLVVATDKQAGIHVYDLDGRRRSYTPAARLNNVDLRERRDGRILVVASDRADAAAAHVSLFALDPATARLRALGRFPVGTGEAYGLCLWTRPRDGALFGFVVMKDGRIDQIAIDDAGAVPAVRTVRSMKLASQSEGCVADDRTGLLYVAEEDVGLWRFAADPAASTAGTAVARVDGRTLVADAEGLALAPAGRRGGYLIASSQGDDAYTLYRLPGVTYAGRFRIGGGAVDGTSETDGIDLAIGDFGPRFRGGLFVAQDGDNAPDTQNFKYVDWGAIVRALRLR